MQHLSENPVQIKPILTGLNIREMITFINNYYLEDLL